MYIRLKGGRVFHFGKLVLPRNPYDRAYYLLGISGPRAYLAQIGHLCSSQSSIPGEYTRLCACTNPNHKRKRPICDVT